MPEQVSLVSRSFVARTIDLPSNLDRIEGKSRHVATIDHQHGNQLPIAPFEREIAIDVDDTESDVRHIRLGDHGSRRLDRRWAEVTSSRDEEVDLDHVLARLA